MKSGQLLSLMLFKLEFIKLDKILINLKEVDHLEPL